MTRKLSLLLAGVLGGTIVLSGCKTGEGPTVLGSGKSSATNSPANGSTDAPSNGPSANTTGSGSGAGGNPSRGPAPAVPAPSVESIPQELKNDAFEYYGLGRKIPITMTLTSGGGPQVGAQDVRLLKLTPEEAQFEIISTDGLNLFGRNVVGLRRDGIRILESEITRTRPNDFELPADLTPGKTWSAVQSMEDGSRSMKVTLVQKVIGPQSITTKIATYPDALFVTGEGTGTFNGKPIKMRTQSWFVKGRGNVKNVIASTQSGRTDTTTIEESK